MPEPIAHQPYAEILKDFRQKVQFLKKEYHLEQRQIAVTLGEHSTNFSRYLDIRRERPCSLKKLIELKTSLEELYVQELARKEAPKVARDIRDMLLAVEKTLNEVHILLTSFTEFNLWVVARLEKKPYSEVAEKWDRNLEEFSKWMKAEQACSTKQKNKKGQGL